MIESIMLKDVATYRSTPVTLSNLSKFNFIYGGNGTGKTTISRVINDDTLYPSCHISWKNSERFEVLAYSRDFVDKNFNESSEFKGIFTLGENNVETLKKIAVMTDELEKVRGKIRNLLNSLNGEDEKGGKLNDLRVVEDDIKDLCWSIKQKYDQVFSKAFEGYRNNKDRFKEKFLEEYSSNSSNLETFDDLKIRAERIFTDQIVHLINIPNIDTTVVFELEYHPILTKRIVGKMDVDIAGMIEKLENSDWVKAGIVFYDQNDLYCPFCQQKTREGLRRSLAEFFDESYLKDTNEIESLSSKYKSMADALNMTIDQILSSNFAYIDNDKLSEHRDLLESKISINIERISNKLVQPSVSVELVTLTDIISDISKMIEDANSEINKHNAMLVNIGQERQVLINQVWKFVVEEIRSEINSIMQKKDNINKAVISLRAQTEQRRKEENEKETEISLEQRNITSVQPAIDGINGYLKSYGFMGFSLGKSEDGIRYKLIREDGTDARETLSEGEKTFITFLYFYHMIEGSVSETGVINDRVLVFDDPISSLDSDVLFLVVGLIRRLFDGVRESVGRIKQLFVLTHNVYFHKEVTYETRGQVFGSDITFWIVRKPDTISIIERYGRENPISTSYQLLWKELGRPESSSPTIQNVMRRILEQYFRILGGINFDSIVEKFDGADRVICGSLFKWLHDGSHSVNDDVYITMNDSVVDKYLRVFKDIFYKLDHSAHYDMMMAKRNKIQNGTYDW